MTLGTAEGQSAPFDLVVFWKQNDSGIYGRRSDRLIEQLARAPQVAQTLHFDAPIRRHALDALARPAGLDHSALIHQTVCERADESRDEPGFVRRTLILDEPDDSSVYDVAERFGDYVEANLRRHGDRPLVFWVYPTNPSLPALIDRFRPQLTVADVDKLKSEVTAFPIKVWVLVDLYDHQQVIETTVDAVGGWDQEDPAQFLVPGHFKKVSKFDVELVPGKQVVCPTCKQSFDIEKHVLREKDKAGKTVYFDKESCAVAWATNEGK